MRFWDSSGLVPLLVEESHSSRTQALYQGDPDVVVWWGTEVECVGAIARRERVGARPGATEDALRRLADVAGRWQEVAPVPAVRSAARRAVQVHELRAADAFQLAAALAAAEGSPSTLELVTLDDRLALAARREGFTVLP